MVDGECRVSWVNPETERLLGWRAKELIGKTFDEYVYTKDGVPLRPEPFPTQQAVQTGQGVPVDRDQIVTRSGDVVHVSIRVRPFGHDKERKAVVVINDVNESVAREEQLTVLAMTDPLNDALNRRSSMAQLQSMVDHPNKQPCVIMTDIDFFKKVNDNYGHSTGDHC